MEDGPAAVAAEIDRRLAGAGGRVTAGQLREWAAEYLRRHDDEVRLTPALAGRPHWNLWMRNDGAADPAAPFAVLIFRPTGLEFFCGVGGCPAVRQFCEHEAPADPDGLFEAMRARFDVPEGPLRLTRPAAEAWLGRPRPW